MTGRKIVFLDIDGTLITDRQEFPESARRVVDEAQRRGHLLFLATGRSLPEIYPWLLDVGFDGIVGGNGSYAQVGDRVLFEHLIPEPRLTALTPTSRPSGWTSFSSHPGSCIPRQVLWSVSRCWLMRRGSEARAG